MIWLIQDLIWCFYNPSLINCTTIPVSIRNRFDIVDFFRWCCDAFIFLNLVNLGSESVFDA